MQQDNITAIVLAGERLNEKSKNNNFGPFTKICNRYAIEYVLDALKNTNQINRINLVANKDKQNTIFNAIQINENIKFVEQESGPSLSTKKALNGLRKPCLVTTGDHPLLTSNTVKLFLKNSVKENADITIGLVPHKLLLDNNILSNRTLYKFRDGNFCGANLFLFRTNRTNHIFKIGNLDSVRVVMDVRDTVRAYYLAMLHPEITNHIFNIWNKIEKWRKRPWKIISFFGVTYLALYLLGIMKFENAEKYLSKRTGLKIKFIEVACFKAAIDLDSERDYPLIKEILGEH